MECSMHGFGLRAPHYAELLVRTPRADFVEAITENHLGRGGRARAVLERVRRDVPVALHGVSLSIGDTEPLPGEYLRELAALSSAIEPMVVSDHLCFARVGGSYGHDLWPLPFTEEALDHVVRRVQSVQEILGRRLLLENVSSYVTYRASTMAEWEFLSEVVRRSGAGVLLDVNNVYVSAMNHGFSVDSFLEAIPVDAVAQFHVAGHSRHDGYLLDDHGSAVPDAVWDVYVKARIRFGPQPTLLEWDENVPSLEELEAECDRGRTVERAIGACSIVARDPADVRAMDAGR